jgi:hypothetical protein
LCRRTGCIVISQISSGRRHASSIGSPARIARYSGNDRPAWRMNQTGVYGTGSPRQAARKLEVRDSFIARHAIRAPGSKIPGRTTVARRMNRRARA